MSVVIIAVFGACSAPVPTVQPDAISGVIAPDSSFVLVDVRSQAELDSTGYIAGAIHLPIRDLEQDPAKAEPFRGKKVVVYCRSGGRATRGVRIMRQKGVEAYNLEGGIKRWLKEGRPVVGGTLQPGKSPVED